MSCYNPNSIRFTLDPETGNLITVFEGNCRYDDPRTFGSIEDISNGLSNSYRCLVPCGHCLGCQIDYSHEWANRMMFELRDNPDAIFVTLTYRNADVPRNDHGDMTLCKRDVQLFFKRLRKHFSDRRIRFYLAGEYGSKTFRPHYHAIIYGLSLNDFDDLTPHGCNEIHDPYFVSKSFEDIWGKGFCLIAQVTYNTCAYVARYTMKKHYASDKDFSDLGIVPEFNLSSRKPGIGMLHSDDLILSGQTHFAVDCRNGVKSVTLPSAFYRHASSSLDANLLSELKRKRADVQRERLLTDLTFSDLSYDEYLKAYSKGLHDRIKLLKDRLTL